MVDTLVVGWDAASWRQVEPLLDAGRLPTLASLIENGASGTLRSTTPPITPAAWTSIATGTTPGRHGIYDFLSVDPGTHEVDTTDYDPAGPPALWDVFDAHGESTGVLNYPMVYPPPSTDGVFVSGFPASADDNIATPPEVANRLEEAGYRNHPEAKPWDDLDRYLKEAREISVSQCDAAVSLLEAHEFDLFAVVFMGIDWVQHYLWDHEGRESSAVDEMYVLMDDLLGRLIEAAEPRDVVVLSDHGARRVDHEVHLNSLLVDLGYLSTASEDSALRRAKAAALGGAWSVGRQLPNPVKRRLRAAAPDAVLSDAREATGANQVGMDETIDWPGTMAFSIGYLGQIYVNDDGRFTNGAVPADYREAVRDELAAELTGLEHPETGEVLFERATPTGEFHYVDDGVLAPDLMVEPADWRVSLYGDFGSPWVQPVTDRLADHDPEGVLVAAGESFAAGSLDASVVDVAPTLLTLHDLPLVSRMQGSPLVDAIPGIDPAALDTVDASDLDGHDTRTRTGDAERVEEHLEDLGYL